MMRINLHLTFSMNTILVRMFAHQILWNHIHMAKKMKHLQMWVFFLFPICFLIFFCFDLYLWFHILYYNSCYLLLKPATFVGPDYMTPPLGTRTRLNNNTYRRHANLNPSQIGMKRTFQDLTVSELYPLDIHSALFLYFLEHLFF